MVFVYLLNLILTYIFLRNRPNYAGHLVHAVLFDLR